MWLRLQCQQSPGHPQRELHRGEGGRTCCSCQVAPRLLSISSLSISPSPLSLSLPHVLSRLSFSEISILSSTFSLSLYLSGSLALRDKRMYQISEQRGVESLWLLAQRKQERIVENTRQHSCHFAVCSRPLLGNPFVVSHRILLIYTFPSQQHYRSRKSQKVLEPAGL